MFTDCDDILVDLGGAVERHLDWKTCTPSPFISLFKAREHAENWALRWSENHGDELCHVPEADISMFRGQYVFDVEELWRTLSASTSRSKHTGGISHHPSHSCGRGDRLSEHRRYCAW